MKVLVAGSNHFDDSAEIWESASEACRDIGRELARAGHDLIVGSASRNTADYHVVSGFVEIEKRGRIRVIRSKDDKSGFLTVPNGTDISYESRGQTWSAARIHQALASDVMLAVGGGKGTHLLAQTAIAVQRPVLPIHFFRGTASTLWKEWQGDLLPAAAVLSGDWTEKSPKDVVRVLEQLRQKNPHRTSGGTGPFGLLMLTVAVLASWIYLLVRSPFEMLPTFFLLIILSVVLGVALRSGLGLLVDPLSVVQLRKATAETVVGVIAGFGLGLLYLIGGFALQQDWSFKDIGGATDVVRVGVVMSIVGLASGFKVEAAVEKLAEHLGVVLKR